MKDLIEKILAYLPRYLKDFGSVVAGPKRFMAEKNTQTDTAYTEALIFLGVSLVLTVIMTAPFLPPGKDLWSYLAGMAVTSILGVSLSALNLRFAWRIVGGKAPIRSFFVIYSYFYSVILIGAIVAILIGVGIFKTLDPDLYTKIVSASINKTPPPDMSGSLMPSVLFLVLAVSSILIAIWCFIAWGAYRQLNGLNRWRSFFAAIIAGVLSWPISKFVFFVGSAISGSNL